MLFTYFIGNIDDIRRWLIFPIVLTEVVTDMVLHLIEETNYHFFFIWRKITDFLEEGIRHIKARYEPRQIELETLFVIDGNPFDNFLDFFLKIECSIRHLIIRNLQIT